MQRGSCVAPAIAAVTIAAPFAGAAVSLSFLESDLYNEARVGGTVVDGGTLESWEESFDQSIDASVTQFGSEADASAFQEAQADAIMLSAVGGANASAFVDAPFVVTADAESALYVEFIIQNPTVFVFDVGFSASASGAASATLGWSLSFDEDVFQQEQFFASEDAGDVDVNGQRSVELFDAGTYRFEIGSLVTLGDNVGKNGLGPSEVESLWSLNIQIPTPASAVLLAIGGVSALARRRK